jgi:hypothetical protein
VACTDGTARTKDEPEGLHNNLCSTLAVWGPPNIFIRGYSGPTAAKQNFEEIARAKHGPTTSVQNQYNTDKQTLLQHVIFKI